MSDISDEALTNHQMIAASMVNGTTVYDPDGTRIGSIEDIMIDKMSGTARFAVLSFGGFLGIGDQHYPLPWTSLKYDVGLGGYVVNVSREQLQHAPAYPATETPRWEDRNWGSAVDEYYAPI
jgi:sporulation protein YlmC with PRC-barrel domain